MRCGRYGFLHEYCDVAALLGETHEVTLTFDGADTEVCDIFVFSETIFPIGCSVGSLPKETPILCCCQRMPTTRSSFLLGVLPYYAGEMGYQWSVHAYFTNHWAVRDRPHEQL